MTDRLPPGDHVRVSVPATSANLGPGYDCLGLALDLRDVVDVWVLPQSETSRVSVSGEGADTVPVDSSHLVLRVLTRVLAGRGVPDTTVRMECANVIPHARGLGSSASAVVAGIAAADALAVRAGAPPLTESERLALAVDVEGHPDNAAPALLGGAALSWMSGSGARARRLAVAADLPCTVIIPPSGLATSVARGVLPSSVPHADAAYNAARAALLVHALGAEPGLLFDATEDRLHQEYRRGVLPESMLIVDALRASGLAAVLSGAGPAVLVLGTGRADVRPVVDSLDLAARPAVRDARVARHGAVTE